MNLKNKLAITIIGLTVAAIQSCTSGKSEVPSIPKLIDAIPVKVISIEKSKTTPVIIGTGKLTTENEAVHAFKMGGVVKDVFVREGDAVRKGQVLAALDLTEIEAHVSQARFNRTKAERDLQRLHNLYRDSVATLEQLENAQTVFDVASQQLEAAEFNMRYGVITSFADGYVLKKFVSAGEIVGVGDPVVMTNATAAGKWILKVGVSAKQWALLEGTEHAVVILDAFPGKKFRAFVFRKSETNDPDTGLFTIELKLHGSDERLATGMFGSAEIQTSRETEFWPVPYEAVLDAHGTEGFVFITRDEKTAVKQAVTIQSFNDQYIEIGSGLDEGDKLIVSGSAYLEDGAPIAIIK